MWTQRRRAKYHTNEELDVKERIRKADPVVHLMQKEDVHLNSSMAMSNTKSISVGLVHLDVE